MSAGSGSGGSGGSFGIDTLSQTIRDEADAITAAIDELSKKEEMNPADMLELQFQMNLFSQLNETAGAVAAAFHEVSRGYIRNINK
jgi:hypothetical protein